MLVCLMGVAHWAAGAGLHEAGAGVQQRARGESGAPVPAQARVPPVPGALRARDNPAPARLRAPGRSAGRRWADNVVEALGARPLTLRGAHSPLSRLSVQAFVAVTCFRFRFRCALQPCHMCDDGAVPAARRRSWAARRWRWCGRCARCSAWTRRLQRRGRSCAATCWPSSTAAPSPPPPPSRCWPVTLLG